jgi:hypothetical protein
MHAQLHGRHIVLPAIVSIWADRRAPPAVLIGAVGAG